MAIYNKNSTLSTTNEHWISSGKGSFTIERNGVERTIKDSKLSFPFPVSIGQFADVHGSSYFVQEQPAGATTFAGEATATTFDTKFGPISPTAINGWDDTYQTNPATDAVIWSGFGKIKISDVTLDIQDLQLPIVVDSADVEMQQGSFAFTSTVASGGPSELTSAWDIIEEDTTVTGDADKVVLAGHGTARVVSGTGVNQVTTTVKLNDIAYPFKLIAGETMTPIGSSLLFTQN